MKTRIAKLVVLGFLVMGAVSFGLAGETTIKKETNTGNAEAEGLLAAYNKWKSESISQGANRYLNISVGAINGLSVESSKARGVIKLDLVDRLANIKIKNLADGDWDIWLMENRPGPNNSTFPDVNDNIVKIGSVSSINGIINTSIDITTLDLADSKIDRVVVTRKGQKARNFVLTGTPTLFEKLYRKEFSNAENPSQAFLPSFLNNIMPTAEANGSSLATLISEGRTVFLSEKFNGNGRTCGTCHPENNNFTLDPEFIATLAPNDPLFVAEFNPALANNFEKPALMRQFGLILENVDGFEDLNNKFVLRGVQQTLGLSVTITAPDPFFAADFTTNGNNPNPQQRLGWSGDGAPGAGTLREFAIGAIIQHFPKTLARQAGSDFRLPTDRELDAMEAFQLSLGRQQEFNLQTLQLKDSQATTGKALFLDTGAIGEAGHKNCNACHFGGGANAAFGLNPAAPGFSPILDANPRGFNGSQGTNTILIPQALANNLPPDGGFGRIPLPTPPNGPGGFGNFGDVPGVGTVPVAEFNSLSLVEAADTAPYFHHNMTKTLEEAIAFYGTPAFQALGSIGGPGGPVPVTISSDPNNSEVKAIGAFLRVLNAVDNIRSTVSLSSRSQQTSGSSRTNLINLALKDTSDAIKVLSSGGLAGSNSLSIKIAITKLNIARSQLNTAKQLSQLGVPSVAVNALLVQAIGSARGARESLVNVNTLPTSFRN